MIEQKIENEKYEKTEEDGPRLRVAEELEPPMPD